MSLDDFALALGFRDQDELLRASETVAVEGDVFWYVTALPDGRWAAWDDRELSRDRVSFHPTRQEAVAHQFSGWLSAGGDRSPTVRWLVS